MFVTGTDTGVGKTVVTAALVLALRGRGLDVGAYKPLQSGNAADDPEGDTMRLKVLGDLPEPPEELCGYAFAAPLAPLVAAGLEEVELALPEVVVSVERAARRHELTLVEGAGGLLVPCGPRWTILDLAAALRFPLVVVARAGLGTVNHTLLTVDAARRRGLGVAGAVLNGDGDESAATNAELIESFGGTRVLGRLPRLEQVTTESLRAAAATIDVEALLAAA